MTKTITITTHERPFGTTRPGQESVAMVTSVNGLITIPDEVKEAIKNLNGKALRYVALITTRMARHLMFNEEPSFKIDSKDIPANVVVDYVNGLSDTVFAAIPTTKWKVRYLTVIMELADMVDNRQIELGETPYCMTTLVQPAKSKPFNWALKLPIAIGVGVGVFVLVLDAIFSK